MDDSEGGLTITWAKFSKAIGKPIGDKVLGVDEFPVEYL